MRTALAVEPRDGRLNVFMHYVGTLEDYLAVIAAVEAAAAATRDAGAHRGIPAAGRSASRVHQGHARPGRDRGEPARRAELARGGRRSRKASTRTRGSTRLGAEKFMRDGRRTGTGGGSHIVVGGATPAESPFLHRPDLLKSIILYWQRHPSLSYLFSGLFIGPTSQSPRIDEARHEALYELEIALAQVPKAGEEARPWLIDRLFRNLLVDVTGNTHRAEICIDKLFSPDRPTGRLGLVEFRAFEMAPDARMSLAQQLLVRALIASFAREPQEGACVRWGTALHDRFMLPHFVWEDFLGVLADLRERRLPIRSRRGSRRSANSAFRSMARSSMAACGSNCATRSSHGTCSPRRPSSGATSRPADSSVERLQVKAEGFNPARHVIACNGRRVPLASTGRSGEYVAGVRFKATMLRVSLHPTLPVHAPLTFDIIDTWSRRSLGGCVYHARIRAARTTTPIRSTRARPRRGGSGASRISATRRARSKSPAEESAGGISDDARPAAAAAAHLMRRPLSCVPHAMPAMRISARLIRPSTISDAVTAAVTRSPGLRAIFYARPHRDRAPPSRWWSGPTPPCAAARRCSAG